MRGQDELQTSFEIASVKPISIPTGIEFDPGRLSAKASVWGLVAMAYGVGMYQVMNAPGWTRNSVYDVEATTRQPASQEQMLLFLRKLLTKRFKLSVHEDTRQIDAWIMSLSPSGPKFRQLRADEALSKGPGTHLRTMVLLIGTVRSLVQSGDTPVLDRTGLIGDYDICLNLSVLGAENHDPGDYIALIKEQLGIEVQLRKTPIKTVVVDHVERPTEN
jgi:bla regulator protein blaR1